MKKRSLAAGLAAGLACLFALVVFTTPLYARDMTAEADLAAGHLRTTVAPGVGDELAMLALLRGGYANPNEDMVTGYIQAILGHIESGGLGRQSLHRTGLQALSLAASGLELHTHAPALVGALSDEAALNAGGLPAAWAALVLFGAAGVAPSAGFDAAAYAEKLAGRANEDGGYGEGSSNGRDTSMALQALAWYQTGSEAVTTAATFAQMWQQINCNDYSGFNMGGEESPTATAEGVLSISALGFDPAHLSYESAPMTDRLADFLEADGTFRFEDTALSGEENALLTLALVAKVRYDRGKTSVFDFSDVVPLDYAPAVKETPAESSTTLPGTLPGADEEIEPEGNSTLWLVVALVMAVVLLVIVLVMLYNAQSKKKRRRRR